MIRISATRLWAVGLTTVLAACGTAATQRSAATFSANQQAIASKDESGGARSSAMSVDDKIAQERLQRDAADKFLSQRIDEESQARLAEDRRLQGEIDALWKALNELADRLTKEVGRLDATDQDLQKQVTGVIADHKASIDKLTADMNNGFAAGREELEKTRKALQDEIVKLAADTKAAQDQQLTELTMAMAKSDADLRQFVKDNADALRGQLEANAAVLRARIALVEAGVATQTIDLAKLKAQLADTEAALSKTKDDFATSLTENIALVRTELKVSSERLTGDIESTKKVLSAEFQQGLTNVKNELLLANAQLANDFKNRLANDIQGVKTLLLAQKEYLAAQITISSGQTRDDFAKDVKRIDATMAKSDAEIKLALTERASDEATLRKDLEQAQAFLTSQIQAVSANLTDQFTNADNALRMKLQAEIDVKVQAVASDLNAFKIYADQTYATKSELKALSLIVVGLQNTTNLLGSKIDATDARLTQETLGLRNDFKAGLSAVQADVNLVKTKLDGHIQSYTATIKDLYAKSADQAAEIGRALQGLQTSQAGLQALNGKLDELTKRVANTEFAATEMRRDLSDALAGLEAKDAELAADVKAAKDAAAQAYATAVGGEQTLRDQMKKQVAWLTSEIVRVEATAKQAQQLALANQDSIKGLRTDLDAAKVQFKDQLNSMHNEFDTKLKAVRDDAAKLVEHLDADTQRQLADFAGTLADLKSRSGSVPPTLARHLNKVADPTAVTVFLTDSQPQFDNMVVAVEDLAEALGTTAGEFMAGIDIIHHAAGVPNLEINKNFKVIAALPECGGITGDRPGEEGQQPAIGGKPWYIHLARAYTRLLIAGARSGDPELDKILFGLKPAAGGSLTAVVGLAVIPPYSLGTGQGCTAKVEDWARGLFTDKGEHGTALRKVLASSARVKAAVTAMIAPKLLAVQTAADNYEKRLVDMLKPNLATDRAVTDFLTQGTDAIPGFRAVLADLLVEESENRYRIAALEQNVASAYDLAKEGAKNLADHDARLKSLETLYASLNAKIDAVAKITPERIQKLEAGVIASFNLIAAIASRLGYEDLVQLARDEAGKLGGDINRDLLIPYGMQACSFYYNYALKEGDPVKRCDAGLDSGKGNFGDSGRCRTIQTLKQVTTNNVVETTVNKVQSMNVVLQRNGFPWQVFTDPVSCRAQVGYWYDWAVEICRQARLGQVAAGYLQDCQSGTKAQSLAVCDTASQPGVVTSVSTSQVVTSQTVQNYPLGPSSAVLGSLRAKILPMNHPHAIEVAKRAEGSPYPIDGETQIVGRFYGNAYYIRATGMNGETFTIRADDFKTQARALNVYEAPISLFLAKSDGAAGFHETAFIEALGADGKPQGKGCNLSMNGGAKVTETSTVDSVVRGGVQWVTAATRTVTALITYSPIVLDLAAKGDVETVNAAEANVLFDFGAEGAKRKVGWIKPTAGFLVLDRNGNGKIDDGSEMFGDHTLLANGQTAKNGYEALAEMAHGKSWVDASDAAFARLRVWVDADQNGVTDAGELKTLADLKITRIGVKAEDVATAERAVAPGQGVPNYKLYQNKYWGPARCGEQGCVTYDVYFGTDHLPVKLSEK